MNHTLYSVLEHLPIVATRKYLFKHDAHGPPKSIQTGRMLFEAKAHVLNDPLVHKICVGYHLLILKNLSMKISV